MKTNPNLLKTLRATTGAAMADCLRALLASDEDLTRAEALLREWGLAEQGKRAERATREGRVFLSVRDGEAALVELRCETDFVAMNASFQEAGEGLAALALGGTGPEEEREMEARVATLGSLFKENIRLGRVARRRASRGEVIETYVHGEGRLGVILAARVAGEGRKDEAFALVHDLALQVAAFKPSFLDLPSVPAAYRAKLLEELRGEIEGDEAARGKSEAIRERMLEGRMRKRLAAACLSEQAFLRDETRKVAELLEEARGGCRVEVRDFVRVSIDEEEGLARGGGESRPCT